MKKLPEEHETLAMWLLSQINAFMDLNDYQPDGALFGWQSVKDCSFVQRLRDGGDIRTAKLEQALAFMQKPVTFNGKLLPLKPLTIKRRELP